MGWLGKALNRAIINASQLRGEKHEYYNEYGGQPVYVVHADQTRDLIYDPSNPDQMGPFGCLLNLPAAKQDLRSPAPDWETPGFMRGMNAADLPDCFLMGPKELAGGKGLGITNKPCRQEIGDCVGACGTTVVEGTLRSEDILGSISNYWIEVSIRYDYWHAQGYYSRPGGDGAATNGLAHGLQTYTDGWLNHNRPDMCVDGRCGGFIHEQYFEGAANLPASIKNGLPYDSRAERAGQAFPVDFVREGVKHRCGYGQGDCRRVRNFDDYRQVIASGHLCFTGIPWPGNWGSVDHDGFVTAPFRGGGGGHEIAFTGYIKRNAQSGYGGSNSSARELAEGDDWWGCMQNSWGLNFGLKGSSIMPRAQMERAGVFGEMFTISYANGWDKSKLINLWTSLYA